MPPARITKLAAVQSALLRWHAEHSLQAPWRASGDPYACLVAAVMAQQTQMSRVLPAYERFTAVYPTLDTLAAASLGDVIRVWAGMGYNQRAVRLHRAARQIAAHGWPRDAASLEKIDGIGPFTAAIIASFAFGERAACVDTNVRRVLGRLAGDPQIGAADLQRLADASIARSAPARWNQAVMDYGARICTPRPRCGECVVARWCASRSMFVATPPLRRAAEQRPPYRVVHRPPKAAGPYEQSDRYRRGRIIDLLRALPPGGALSMRRLPALLDGSLSQDDALKLVNALVAHGLVVRRRGSIGLPE
jgi:A/G-specific adenine glycosylase